MSSFSVKVTKINAIEPIQGADKIELAVIGDYRSVVGKGQFVAGDLAVYIPEASIVPQYVLERLNLVGKLSGKQKDRVKAIKLLGHLSQGILYPVTVDLLDQTIGWYIKGQDNKEQWVNEGDDVAEYLGIVKYNPPIPVHMAGEVYNAGQHVTVNFDVENYKKYPDVLINGEEVVFSEKLHGTFCGVGILPDQDHDDNHIQRKFVIFSKGLGADGLCFKDNQANAHNVYVQAVKQSGLLEKLERFSLNPSLFFNVPMFVLGEVFGVGVQDLGYGNTKPSFRAFKILSGYRGDQKYAGYEAFNDICTALGIDTVPILYRGPFSKEVMMEYTDGVETVSGQGMHIREGIVIEPVATRRDPNIGNVLLKSVSEAYLLRKGNVSEYQ